MTRIRFNVRLEPDIARQLDLRAERERISKSMLIAAALLQFMAPEIPQAREAAIIARLNQLASRFDDIEKEQGVMLETLVLFIRHHFAIVPSIPSAQEDAARAQAKTRFDQFVTQLRRQMSRGQRFSAEVQP